VFGSIRRSLILLVLSVSVPLMLATLLVVERLAAAQRQSERDSMLASTRGLVAAVDSEINRYLGVAATLSKSRTLRAGNLADFYELARETLAFLPNSWLVLTDRQGQQLINTLRPFGTGLPACASCNSTRERSRPAVFRSQMS
jgi:hypothetical protein